jgi:parallel beta-helix repeat protein
MGVSAKTRLGNGPFIVTNKVIVPSGVTLTIEPGTLIKFEKGASLQVYGVLNAQGTESNLITFTSNEPSLAKGDWSGVYLTDSGSAQSLISYCKVEYSSNGIQFYNTSPSISHVISSNNINGFFFYNSSPQMTDVTASQNETGLYLQSQSSPTILYSKIINNTKYGIYLKGSTGSEPNPLVNR